MDINKILEYQKKDGELIKLEKTLLNSKYRKIYTQMIGVVKECQSRSAKLEKDAENFLLDFERLKKSYTENISSTEKITGRDVDALSEKDVASLLDVSQQVSNNLNILEKKLYAQAEKVNAILNEFEQSKKKYIEAKNKHGENKKLYEEEAKAFEPQINEIKKELMSMEKNIDPMIMEKYKKRREDKIFPIFVPLSDRACGGCMMELSYVVLENIKKNGYLECENCRRIMYLV